MARISSQLLGVSGMKEETQHMLKEEEYEEEEEHFKEVESKPTSLLHTETTRTTG
jgi:hypothetical protein